MNKEQIQLAASILDDLLGKNFHDAICEAMGSKLELTNDWFPSDENIYEIKDELIELLKN